MSWRDIFTVYRKELKDMLRDRRALLSMIIIPTFVMPLLTFGVGKVALRVTAKVREEIPTVVILGGEDSPGVVAELKQSPRLRVGVAPDDWKQQIADKKIRAAVRLPAGFEAGLRTGLAPPVVFYHYEGELRSQRGLQELEDFFRALRERTVVARLGDHGLPATLAQPFEFHGENVAPPEKVGGNLAGGFIPYVILLLCFTGAMYPALDLTAGEKERGTMETLLCSPVARGDIVLGKFLMVLTGSLAAMILSATSMGLSLAIGRALAPGLVSTLPRFSPVGILGVIGLTLPVAVLFSAVLFTVALFAKSFKEAQSYVSPLMIIVVLPAVIGMLPGIDLNARLALVPVLNISLACREMLSGVWHWPWLALIFGSTCAYAAIALALAVRMFKREDVLFRT